VNCVYTTPLTAFTYIMGIGWADIGGTILIFTVIAITGCSFVCVFVCFYGA